MEKVMRKIMACPHCEKLIIIVTSIDIKAEDTKREYWVNFVDNLDLPNQVHNTLIRAYWQFNKFQDSYFKNEKEFNDVVGWFIQEINKPHGGKTASISNFGIKSLETVREKLLVKA